MPARYELLQWAFTNDLGRIGPGRAQYTHLLDPDDAHVVDDIIVWWVGDDEFLVMPNASNTDAVARRARRRRWPHADGACTIADITDEPRRARGRRAPPPGSELAALQARCGRRPPVRGPDGRVRRASPAAVAGTGYTGEDGVELHVPRRSPPRCWRRPARRRHPARRPRRPRHAAPRGRPSRSTATSSAPASRRCRPGSRWVVRFDKGDFRGRAPLLAERERGIPRRLRGLVLDGRQIPRAGYAVQMGEERVGEVTSGNFSPVLERGIALAFLPPRPRRGRRGDRRHPGPAGAGGRHEAAVRAARELSLARNAVEPERERPPSRPRRGGGAEGATFPGNSQANGPFGRGASGEQARLVHSESSLTDGESPAVTGRVNLSGSGTERGTATNLWPPQTGTAWTRTVRAPEEPMASEQSLAELEASDEFVGRHIGPDVAEQARMLAALDLPSIEDLVDRAVPDSIRTREPLRVPPARSEADAVARLRDLARRNEVFTSLIGMGYSDTVTPPVILRNVLEDPAWYTAYTPYQPEISQGRLEALLNFQTMVSDLTGMEIANASLLDEATAAGEAMAMFRRLNPNAGETFVVDADCHPQTIDVVRTRAEPIGVDVVVVDPGAGITEAGVFGALLQYPGSSGAVRDLRPVIEQLHAAGCARRRRQRPPRARSC